MHDSIDGTEALEITVCDACLLEHRDRVLWFKRGVAIHCIEHTAVSLGFRYVRDPVYVEWNPHLDAGMHQEYWDHNKIGAVDHNKSVVWGFSQCPGIE